ncbi:MAG: zinc-binding alcohol dehydrogenase family protein [Flavobacteriaceae bacterium]|jgi:NADPH:quinone reductase-like Zn-dependent oxidoreductase|nr:zinc-binding alcohol dehydrogenase family protein [Flavobacteriaceae bacterium]
MKAAILYKSGDVPQYGDIEAPKVNKENEKLVKVKAVAIKNLDKARVNGKHYASYTVFPTTVGVDGVGILEDGSRVYANGITGMLAEQAIIGSEFTPVPPNLDDVMAAALPNAVLGSAMPLLIRAKLQAGQNVLFNGATGVTGQIAVQIAKHYGANEVIVTGRNANQLKKLLEFGATQVIDLKASDEEIQQEILKIQKEKGIDIIIDYLWGKPISLLLSTLSGKGIDYKGKSIKVVTAGDMAGKEISLSSAILRSTDIQILGSGFGSLSKEELIVFNKMILPEIYSLAAAKKVSMDTVVYPLNQIEEIWTKPIEAGKRLVITIDNEI